MKCLDCPLKYIGQTGRTFNLRYKEHNHAIRSNCSKSGYSNHILNTGHTYGTITDTMDHIMIGGKSRHLNTLERYHIVPRWRYLLGYRPRHLIFHTLYSRLHRRYYNRSFTNGSLTSCVDYRLLAVGLRFNC
jgi:hypothetical protein